MSAALSAIADDLSERYLAWSRSAGAPFNTVKSRARTLRSIGNAGTATREQVEAWWFSRGHLAPASRALDLSNLRAFYLWCRRWEHRDDDPTLRLDAPHVDPGLPRPIGRADLHTALAALPGDLRRAVCLGAYAGLRVSEAAALDWSNVDMENRQIRVMNSKGGKSRLVPIGPTLLDALLPRTGGNVVTGGADGPLLTSGIPYTASRLAKRVSSAFRRLGIDATFHQLRHRYGTLAYAASGDLLAVGRLLGHASPVTTAIYVATRDEVAAKIALAVSA
jgi:integrase